MLSVRDFGVVGCWLNIYGRGLTAALSTLAFEARGFLVKIQGFEVPERKLEAFRFSFHRPFAEVCLLLLRARAAQTWLTII